jgi:hypothetical protein
MFCARAHICWAVCIIFYFNRSAAGNPSVTAQFHFFHLVQHRSPPLPSQLGVAQASVCCDGLAIRVTYMTGGYRMPYATG